MLPGLHFDRPDVLWLLLLVVLPLLRGPGRGLTHPSIGTLSRDLGSRVLDPVIRILLSALVAMVVLALAGAGSRAQPREQIRQGAEIVVLLDRSRSMDQPLAQLRAIPNLRGNTPVYSWSTDARESKARVAQGLLAGFIRARPQDRFAVTLFSTQPLRIAGFSSRHDVAAAALEASGLGRGLADTDMGLALEDAVGMFRNQPYAGTRVVLLVSDGGAHLTPDSQLWLRQALRREHISLYWIYLRSAFSPGLMMDQAVSTVNADTVPERFLFEFFSGIGTPFKAYEATSPDAMQKAIDDISRLENRPLRYTTLEPVTSWTTPLLFMAALLAFLLSALHLGGRRQTVPLR